MLDDNKLDFFIKTEQNVLFRGMHGVGKTAMVKAAFERNNLVWSYFSAATMDPWVDFVGVPKEMKNEETGETYITMVRPENFENGKVQAIFMDELNRSKDKVRNAVMELIQFKSINGTPFPNLKIVWAAINPEDDDENDLSYDVERLDPAQIDRFQIILDIPYKASKEYFSKRYGESGIGAVEWWNELTKEQNLLVSPRRLEYAIEQFQNGGDLRDVLPHKQLNLTQLRERLSSGSITVKLKKLFDNNDDKACKKEFSNINFVTDALNTIKKNKEYIDRFLGFIPKDIISKTITENDCEDAKVLISNAKEEVIVPILASILATRGIKREMLQKIELLSKERGLDLTSENAFKTAIEEGLAIVNKDRSERYNALHSILHNFNKKASRDMYEECVHFICKIIYHTQESALKDVSKPYRQMGGEILRRTEEILISHNSSVDKVWGKLKTTTFSDTDDDRISRIEKYLEIFITDNVDN